MSPFERNINDIFRYSTAKIAPVIHTEYSSRDSVSKTCFANNFNPSSKKVESPKNGDKTGDCRC